MYAKAFKPWCRLKMAMFIVEMVGCGAMWRAFLWQATSKLNEDWPECICSDIGECFGELFLRLLLQVNRARFYRCAFLTWFAYVTWILSGATCRAAKAKSAAAASVAWSMTVGWTCSALFESGLMVFQKGKEHARRIDSHHIAYWMLEVLSVTVEAIGMVRSSGVFSSIFPIETTKVLWPFVFQIVFMYAQGLGINVYYGNASSWSAVLKGVCFNKRRWN